MKMMQNKLAPTQYRTLDELNRVTLPKYFRTELGLAEGDCCTLLLSEDNEILELWKSNQENSDTDIKVSGAGQVMIPASITHRMALEKKTYLCLKLELSNDAELEHPRKIKISKKMPGCTECGSVIATFNTDPLVCDECIEKVIVQHMNPRCLDGRA